MGLKEQFPEQPRDDNHAEGEAAAFAAILRGITARSGGSRIAWCSMNTLRMLRSRKVSPLPPGGWLRCAPGGLPFLKTANAGHFGNDSQEFLQIEISATELRVREFATKDGWATAAWTQQVWSFPLNV